MGRSDENEKQFKSVSYFRLLAYARPYWLKLTVGIFFGLIVGGSIFGSMMILPQMMMIVDQDTKHRAMTDQMAEKIVTDIESDPALSAEEKKAVVTQILHPDDPDPKLTDSMNKLRDYSKKFNLPMEVGTRSVEFTWPTQFEFPVVDRAGRMTWQFFSIYVVAFILIWALKNMATYLNHYFTRWVGSRAIADMRDDIYRRLVSQSMLYFGRQDVGHLISRCTNDTAAIEDSVSNVIADLTRCPIEVLSCLAAVIYFASQQQNVSVLVLLVVGMPVCLMPVAFLAKRIRKIYRKAFANIAEVMSRMHETFTGILVIKSNDMEKEETERFKYANNKFFRTLMRALRKQLLMQPLMELIAVSATLIFLVYSYSQGVTISQMAVLLAPMVLAYRPLKDMTKVINHIQRSMAAADRYFDIIDTDTALPEKADAVTMTEFKNEIAFQHVSFAYTADHPILRDVSFRIPRGSMVAVVGETGSGKTTIANLIARLYDVNSGEVLIDGVNVKDFSTKSLRQQIGIVTQTPVLFNDSIANNIAYGCKRAVTREEIIEAAKQANAHDFIVAGGHALGYDEEVGEKGFLLSGGEKQRIAIARAILKNPPILILDEATSALDTVTEKLVQDALNHVMANRTVFAIAHRLSTIQNADCIIVLEKGLIIESGTHAELLTKGGLYKKLHDTQYSHTV